MDKRGKAVCLVMLFPLLSSCEALLRNPLLEAPSCKLLAVIPTRSICPVISDCEGSLPKYLGTEAGEGWVFCSNGWPKAALQNGPEVTPHRPVLALRREEQTWAHGRPSTLPVSSVAEMIPPRSAPSLLNGHDHSCPNYFIAPLKSLLTNLIIKLKI